MLYSAYHLLINSELPLPELHAAPPLAVASAADLHIRSAHVSPDGLVGAKRCNEQLWLAPQALWLHVPGVARFLVRGGDEILVDAEAGSDAAAVRLFLLGSALGALLFQRGHLVLHGNAIRVGDQCLVCVGQSGVGKSTLAAGFALRGYAVLADDVVALDPHGRALPGPTRIKLWQDAADRLGIKTATLARIRPQQDKFNVPMSTDAPLPALPVRWIYVLDGHDAPDFHIEAVQGRHRFAALHENTYRMHYLQGMALEAGHLQRCGQLAGQIRLARVQRPRAGFRLPELMDLLLDDVARHP